MKNLCKSPLLILTALSLSACTVLVPPSLGSSENASGSGAMPLTSSAGDSVITSSAAETKEATFTVKADYGKVVKDCYTLLWDNIAPFFSWSDYGIRDDFLPEDQFVVTYTGTMVVRTSYPGQMDLSSFHIVRVRAMKKNVWEVDQTALRKAIGKYADYNVITDRANHKYQSLTDFLAPLSYTQLFAVEEDGMYQSFVSDVPRTRLTTEAL